MVQIIALSTPKKEETETTPQRRTSSARRMSAQKLDETPTTPLRRSARVAAKSPPSPYKTEDIRDLINADPTAPVKNGMAKRGEQTASNSRVWAFFLAFLALAIIVATSVFISSRFDLPRLFVEWRRSLSAATRGATKNV